MTAAIAVGILVAAGIYLILQRGLIRVTIGFVMLGHAANILVVSAGGMRLRGAPLIGHGEVADMADPLPQAFVLTAIVITFGITVYLLALARAGGEDDPEPEALDPDAPDAPESLAEPEPPGAGEPAELDDSKRADTGHGPQQEQAIDVEHITDDRGGS